MCRISNLIANFTESVALDNRIYIMASKFSRNYLLRPAAKSARTRLLRSWLKGRARPFSVSASRYVALPRDSENLRKAPRSASGTLEAPPVNPADQFESKADSLHRYGAWLMGCIPKYIQQVSLWKDELTIYVVPSGVIPVFSFLKGHTASEFSQISAITAVDYPSREKRFEIVYNLLSVRYNSRIRVKTYADESSSVPSVTSLYDGANWYEREVYDLFGVFFTGHPDLRRIMTDYGFEGHPLRKDFPLTGYTEIRYDEEKKRIVTEPLELTQAFRNFEGGTSAWEQIGPGSDRKPDSFKLPQSKPVEKGK